MSALKFFTHPLSQPCRAVTIFLQFTGIPHELVLVDLRQGEHMTDEYAKNINRFRKVPAINYNGFKLSESVAIFRYLNRKFPEKTEIMYPKNDEERARVDEYMEWQHNNLRSYGSLYFRTKFLTPRLTKEPINEKRAEKLLDGLKSCLDVIEEVWLSENKFIAGNTLSVADLLAVCELEQPGMGGYDAKIDYPKIKEYMERVRSLLNPYYDQVHEAVHGIQKKQVMVNAKI